jgi:hypothetical protein
MVTRNPKVRRPMRDQRLRDLHALPPRFHEAQIASRDTVAPAEFLEAAASLRAKLGSLRDELPDLN